MDISALNALSNALNGVDIGENILYGRVEAYSCTCLFKPADQPAKCVCEGLGTARAFQLPAGDSGWLYFADPWPNNDVSASGKMTGNDRKLQVALEQSIQDQLGSPNHDRLSVSPFGPLTDRLSRQTLIYLITTLNCAFPYYDFRYAFPTKSNSWSTMGREKRENAKNELQRQWRESDFLFFWPFGPAFAWAQLLCCGIDF